MTIPFRVITGRIHRMGEEPTTGLSQQTAVRFRHDAGTRGYAPPHRCGLYEALHPASNLKFLDPCLNLDVWMAPATMAGRAEQIRE